MFSVKLLIGAGALAGVALLMVAGPAQAQSPDPTPAVCASGPRCGLDPIPAKPTPASVVFVPFAGTGEAVSAASVNDVPSRVPSIGKIVNAVNAASANVCYTVAPIAPRTVQAAQVEQTAAQHIFLPLVEAQPMCVDPRQWAGVIALLSGDQRIIPGMGSGSPVLRGSNLPQALQVYPLGGTIGEADSVGKSLPTELNGFKRFKVFAYPMPVNAASVEQGPDSPADLEAVKWVERGLAIDKRIRRGLMASAFPFPDSTVLRKLPLVESPALTFRQLCPGWPRTTAGAHIFAIFPDLEAPRMTAWVLVHWGMDVVQGCPLIQDWHYINIEDFWKVLPLEEKISADVIVSTLPIWPVQIQMQQNPDVAGSSAPASSTARVQEIDYPGMELVFFVVDEVKAHWWYVLALLPE